MTNIARLRDFVQRFTRLIDESGDNEERIFIDGKALLAKLIADDDWLPEQFAQARPERYQQYLLYCDPLERFSVVSFVWGPGQATPVHDHTVWGMVGVMRGAELCEEFHPDPVSGGLLAGNMHRVMPGDVDLVSPRIGDIHRVSNALADRPSISIHAYGGNIGAIRRHTYEPPAGYQKPFISGYSSPVTPNLWDRSADLTPGATSGELYVAEQKSGNIARIAPDGTVTKIAAGLAAPHNLAMDDRGNLYVAETMTGRILKFSGAF